MRSKSMIRCRNIICIGLAAAMVVVLTVTGLAKERSEETRTPEPEGQEAAWEQTEEEIHTPEEISPDGEEVGEGDALPEPEGQTPSGETGEEAPAVEAESPDAPEGESSSGEQLAAPAAETRAEAQVTVEPTESDLDNGVETSRPVEFPDGITSQGSGASLELDTEDILALLESLPEDTAPERIAVVLKAVSLEGKVNYFWGGKSDAIGWDERWGNRALVTSEGSRSTGTLRSYGLDCSGFVTWAFTNAAGSDMSGGIGHGTTNQWAYSQAVEWEDAQPGDLAFFYSPSAGSTNHVGIVVGYDGEGNLLVAHCSSGSDNVVVTGAESTGFQYIRSPDLYDDPGFVEAAAENGYARYWLWRSTRAVSWREVAVGDMVFPAGADLLAEDGEIGLVVGVPEGEEEIWLLVFAREGNYLCPLSGFIPEEELTDLWGDSGAEAGDEALPSLRRLPALSALNTGGGDTLSFAGVSALLDSGTPEGVSTTGE